jgi:hypothetical protein
MPQAGIQSEEETFTYASGEIPQKGDVIATLESLRPKEVRSGHPINDQTWVVTTICHDMVKAKCLTASSWREAFFTSQMSLIKRPEKPSHANPKHRISRTNHPAQNPR